MIYSFLYPHLWGMAKEVWYEFVQIQKTDTICFQWTGLLCDLSIFEWTCDCLWGFHCSRSGIRENVLQMDVSNGTHHGIHDSKHD